VDAGKALAASELATLEAGIASDIAALAERMLHLEHEGAPINQLLPYMDRIPKIEQHLEHEGAPSTPGTEEGPQTGAASPEGGTAEDAAGGIEGETEGEDLDLLELKFYAWSLAGLLLVAAYGASKGDIDTRAGKGWLPRREGAPVPPAAVLRRSSRHSPATWKMPTFGALTGS